MNPEKEDKERRKIKDSIECPCFMPEECKNKIDRIPQIFNSQF
jgi:hypothetical protein